MVWFQFLAFAVLLFALVKSSDYFVEAVARIAKYLGVSELVIGLTIVAIGTSLPELGASTMASFAGETELAIGNIIGSNLANIGLILGMSAVLLPLKTNRHIFMRDCLILMLISLLFAYFASDGVVETKEGAILLLTVPLYLAYLFKSSLDVRKRIYKMGSFLKDFYKFNKIGVPQVPEKVLNKDLKGEKYEDFVGTGFDIESYNDVRNRISFFKKGLAKDSIIVILSGLGVYFSATYLIPVTVEIAKSFGVSTSIIGSTIIAIGTSLPELSVSLSSVKKGFGDLVLGNVIGSNIFNMAFVGGVASTITPLTVIPQNITFSLPLMLISTLLLFIFVRTGWRVKKYEGIVLFALYLVFLLGIIGIF